MADKLREGGRERAGEGGEEREPAVRRGARPEWGGKRERGGESALSPKKQLQRIIFSFILFSFVTLFPRHNLLPIFPSPRPPSRSSPSILLLLSLDQSFLRSMISPLKTRGCMSYASSLSSKSHLSKVQLVSHAYIQKHGEKALIPRPVERELGSESVSLLFSPKRVSICFRNSLVFA